MKCIVASALRLGRNGHYLRCPKNLTEALVLRKVESLIAAVVHVRDVDRSAVGEPEFVAAEGRNPARICGRRMVKVVTGVERGVTHEFKEGAVEAGGPGTGNDVGKSGRSPSDVGGHPTGTRLDAFDGVHIEVGKCRSAHLRIADVGAI